MVNEVAKEVDSDVSNSGRAVKEIDVKLEAIGSIMLSKSFTLLEIELGALGCVTVSKVVKKSVTVTAVTAASKLKMLDI